MKRRLIAAALSILVATVGAVLLFTYVSGVDQRAMAGMQTSKVLVVSKFVTTGTPAEGLAGLVTTKTLPAVAVAAGTVTTLADVRGLVTTSDLQPGEQLLASRFADPATLAHAHDVQIPKGMQQVSISLDTQRVVGGYVTPGATVGVFVSLPKDDKVPAQTHLVLNKVLVSKVEGGHPAAPAETDKATPSPQADGVMVTLVLSGPDAEKVVFGVEHGTIWLSLESAPANGVGTRVVTAENLNK